MTSQKLIRLLLIAPLLAISFSCVQGQGRGVNADRTRAIEQAEMDRILMFAVPKDKESEAVRLSQFKKIKEDFRDLQSFNNKMMADAWMQGALDYSAIADMVSKIKGRANSLKSSLTLPEPEKSNASLPTVTTVRQFREELLLLDKTVMRFVNNPVFQAANGLDVNQAKTASEDLDRVLSLTDDVKQNAQKLRKTAH
ncbi:MAG TPA: hypothetical protein VI306_05765 [Pyrinomonadaceae bacterium]